MDFALQIDMIIECGDSDPNTLTNKLNVIPTSVGVIGERNPRLMLPRASYWSRRSDASSPDASVADHWASIAPHVVGKESIIRDAGSAGRNRMTIIVDATGRAPSVIIPPDMARFAADIHADIDVDIYQ